MSASTALPTRAHAAPEAKSVTRSEHAVWSTAQIAVACPSSDASGAFGVIVTTIARDGIDIVTSSTMGM